MNRALQSALRRLTQVTRPIAMRKAGTVSSKTSLVRHIGRTSGRSYETPIVTVEYADGFLIALPYGARTDWLKNVVANGRASIVTGGQTYDVDRPQIVPMSEATAHFKTKEQKLHRRFGIESCLQVHRLVS